jgi:hypothetical protein
MTPTPPAVTRESFAEGLMQAFTALEGLTGLAWDIGENASVSTEVTVLVHSEAEVDAAAALLGGVPHRLAGQYLFLKREGTVTVTVALCASCASCGHAGSAP